MPNKKSETIHERLNYIQTKLNAPKNLYNKFGNYSYRNLEGIFEGLKPLLAEKKCVVFVTDEIVCINEMNYIKATATISCGYGDEHKISVSGYAREAIQKKGMDTSQITGSTSSYARKYALNGLFAIDDVKDADSMDNSDNNDITKKQRETISKLLTEVKDANFVSQVETALKNGKVTSINYDSCISSIKKKIN